MTAENFISELNKFADPARAEASKRFFKTGPGQYGEGDKFIGANMPNTRKVCRRFIGLDLSEVQELFNSPIHEHRMGAAVILTNKYPKVNEIEKQKIFEMYLENLAASRINNWDIVDVSCGYVVGAHLANKDKELLHKLAKSNNLWERRTAIISTFYYIKHGDASDTLKIADILLKDKHDLIHKAVGWMLREVGGRVDQKLLTKFLDKHAHEMPRTMLRYSIEKLSADLKQKYMKMKFGVL